MSRGRSWFEVEVSKDWSVAVMAAAHQYSAVRLQVLEALQSDDAEVRAAAVATCNEADDRTAHDFVLALFRDSNANVRAEVLEYVAEFPEKCDALKLLEALASREHVFLATSGLQKLYGERGPLVYEDQDETTCIQAVQQWGSVVRAQNDEA